MSESAEFEALLNQFDQEHPQASKGEPAIGDPVRGTLIAIGEEVAYVDLGGKYEGRIEVSALRDAEGNLALAVGDSIETRVSGKDEETGMLLLGSQHGHRMHGLDEIERAYRQGQPVQGQVTGAVKGGIEVQVSGLRGFCPASQADLRFIEDLSEFVGQRLDFRVTKLEGGRRPNLVLSRRALLEEEQRQRAEQVRARLVEGAVLTGTVSSLKDYGAFVDLGGLEGMIHISELAFGHVKHPSELLTLGQTVEVSVLRVEPAKGPKQREKIALSIRALGRDPWRDVPSDYPIGTAVEGRVTRLQPFGVFVELAPGIEGLAHISELGAGRRINHPSEVIAVGDRVRARVLNLDTERRRIGLSLEPARGEDAPAEAATEGAAPPAARPAGHKASGPAGRPGGRAAEPTADPGLGSFGALLREQMTKREGTR